MLMLFLDKMESHKISLTVFWYVPMLGGDSHCESNLSFTRAQQHPTLLLTSDWHLIFPYIIPLSHTLRP